MPLSAMSDNIGMMECARLSGLGAGSVATMAPPDDGGDERGGTFVDPNARGGAFIDPNAQTPVMDSIFQWGAKKIATAIDRGREVSPVAIARDDGQRYIFPVGSSEQGAPRKTPFTGQWNLFPDVKAAPQVKPNTVAGATKSVVNSAVAVAPLLTTQAKMKKKPQSNVLNYVLISGGILIGGILLFSMFKGKR